MYMCKHVARPIQINAPLLLFKRSVFTYYNNLSEQAVT